MICDDSHDTFQEVPEVQDGSDRYPGAEMQKVVGAYSELALSIWLR